MTLESQRGQERVGIWKRLRRFAGKERRTQFMLPMTRRYEAWRTARAERRAARLEQRAGSEAAIERQVTLAAAPQEDDNVVGRIFGWLADIVKRERDEDESGQGRGKFSWVSAGLFAIKLGWTAGTFMLIEGAADAFIPGFKPVHDFLSEVVASTGLEGLGADITTALVVSTFAFGIFAGAVYADRNLNGGRFMSFMSRQWEKLFRLFSNRKRRDGFAV